MVILEWFVISIAYNSHHRLHEGFTCAQIPILEARHQINVEIGLFVKHVHNFVASTCDSVNIHGLQGLIDLVRALLILIH